MFGFLEQFKEGIEACSSEIGLQVMLFSLAVAIQAETIIEIGRFKGSSTLALAGALHFLDTQMKYDEKHCERPFINYKKLHELKNRKIYSIDPAPRTEAEQKLGANGFNAYVELINNQSWNVNLEVQADLILVDGDHTLASCAKDTEKFINNNLKVGGYFILHDYYGWFGNHADNNSPIKMVCDRLVSIGIFEHILIDTKYMSFMIFRKKHDMDFKVGL